MYLSLHYVTIQVLNSHPSLPQGEITRWNTVFYFCMKQLRIVIICSFIYFYLYGWQCSMPLSTQSTNNNKLH